MLCSLTEFCLQSAQPFYSFGFLGLSCSVSSVQSLSHVQLCDPMDRSMPGFPVITSSRSLLRLTSIKSGDAIQSSHPPLSLSPAFNLSQHQGLFQWVSSSHQMAKVLEFELQHQSFQWTPRTDLLWDCLVSSPCSPRASQEISPTAQFNHQLSWVQLSWVLKYKFPAPSVSSYFVSMLFFAFSRLWK